MSKATARLDISNVTTNAERGAVTTGGIECAAPESQLAFFPFPPLEIC
jgi:hypothetical protein